MHLQSGDGDAGRDWVSAGASRLTIGGSAPANGRFSYLTMGRDVRTTGDLIYGYTVGIEQNHLDTQSETDTDKCGFSIGTYGARTLGDLSLTGAFSLTHFSNQYQNNEGARATATSIRFLSSVEVSRQIDLGQVGSIRPYGQMAYVYEDVEGFSYSDGNSFSPGMVDMGAVRLGGEFRQGGTAAGQFFARADISQQFLTHDVKLSDDSLYNTADNPRIHLGLGYDRTGNTTDIRLELSVSDLGNDNREEISISGLLEHHY